MPVERGTILLVDDFPPDQQRFASTLREAGHVVEVAENGESALAKISERQPQADRPNQTMIRPGQFDLVLLDIHGLGRMDGFAVLKELRQNLGYSPDDLPVIIITGSSGERTGSTQEDDIDLAMELDANDYLTKDMPRAVVRQRVVRELALKQARVRLQQAQEQRWNYDLKEIVGNSRALRAVLDEIKRGVEGRLDSFFLYGERGTGKEPIARLIHKTSGRRGEFVVVNCGAIPDALFENELFGYKKGVFTGADRERIGIVEQAKEGTLFLDEVGDLTAVSQGKLLRFLEEKKYRALGSNVEVPVDVWVIAATNKDLDAAVTAGHFRADLRDRLAWNVRHRIPPLRERDGDVPELIQHFMELYCKELHKDLRLAEDLRDRLCRHDWPGNVRDLKNLLETLVRYAGRTEVTMADLPLSYRELFSHDRPPAAAARTASARTLPELKERHEQQLRELIQAQLEESESVSGAARALDVRSKKTGKVSESNLREIMTRLGISMPGSRAKPRQAAQKPRPSAAKSKKPAARKSPRKRTAAAKSKKPAARENPRPARKTAKQTRPSVRSPRQ